MSRNAEKEYAFKLFLSLNFYQNVLLTVPPPLNAPYVLWRGFTHLCGCKRMNAKAAAKGGGKVGAHVEALARDALRRQLIQDEASLEALAEALPNNVERLNSQVAEKIGALRSMIESRTLADSRKSADDKPAQSSSCSLNALQNSQSGAVGVPSVKLHVPAVPMGARGGCGDAADGVRAAEGKSDTANVPEAKGLSFDERLACPTNGVDEVGRKAPVAAPASVQVTREVQPKPAKKAATPSRSAPAASDGTQREGKALSSRIAQRRLEKNDACSNRGGSPSGKVSNWHAA